MGPLGGRAAGVLKIQELMVSAARGTETESHNGHRMLGDPNHLINSFTEEILKILSVFSTESDARIPNALGIPRLTRK